jgi:hypothetical protein
VCKHIFLHPTYGLVFVRDAMRCSECERYELSPLLLYALSIQDTAIRRLTFAPPDQPHAIYDTLHRLWSQEVQSFRGRPDAVVLSRQVAAASPTIVDRLALDGVELIVADKGEKVSGAALRTAQHDSLRIGWHSADSGISSLRHLEDRAADQHRFDQRIYAQKFGRQQEQWAAIPCRAGSAPTGVGEMDWSPGPWLTSWEVNLPPVSQPRFFHKASDRQMWLIAGIDPAQDESEENEEQEDEMSVSEYDSAVVELAKDLVACWPNSAAEIASAIGTTAREMKWLLDGKASFDKRTLYEMLSILSIEWVDDDGYEATGPCVLVANNIGPATRIYDRLSHGGDLDFSYEVVPESGQADPSWRYLLFQSYGGVPNILMFGRGSKESDRLNDKAFINFEGLRPVPNKLYRDVVATCARASQSPLANRREMLGFEERQPGL